VRNFRSSAPFPLAVRQNGTRVFLLQTTIRQSKPLYKSSRPDEGFSIQQVPTRPRDGPSCS
jgi:hypothetical protein